VKLLLDEGVPVSVGRVFEVAGHDVVYFDKSGLAKGSADPIVCAAAEASGAILVAADHDMKRLAKGHGIAPARFKQMGLIRFECEKPNAANRLSAALSLIEHEHSIAASGKCDRVFVIIAKATIRVHR
jgi:predicted nuclease of predicted toxin-antitoxin system